MRTNLQVFFTEKKKMIKLSELLDNDMLPKPPQEIKTSDDELDNYNKKAKPAPKDVDEPDIDLQTIETEIGENTMGIKLSNLMENEQEKLSSRQKREVLEAVKSFNEFASKVYRTNEINDMVEAIKTMTSQAGQLALQETDGWFDSVTVKNDVKGIGGSVDQFSKTAKEISTLQQRLESVFEDIGHKLGKYYEISEAMDAVGKEDGDVDNDGDEDASDEYLTKKRAAISNAIEDEEDGSVNEAVKPVKLSGNLKKDLKTVTDMAGKMVKYAKDNFNTYIPTGHMLSQLINGGSTEKDVLKYNISHLAKAINTDLKKKYMKDFVGESVNESVGGFRGIATGRSNFGKVRYDGWKRSHEPIKEAAPKMRKNKEAENLQKLMNQVANAQKGGGDGRYGKEFDKSKTKALRAIKDMVMYSNIGI